RGRLGASLIACRHPTCEAGLCRFGVACVESQLEERAEILAGREHLVPRPARRQLHDPHVVVAVAVAACIGGRFVDRRQRSTTAEKAHGYGISRMRAERKSGCRSLRPKKTSGPQKAPTSAWVGAHLEGRRDTPLAGPLQDRRYE